MSFLEAANEFGWIVAIIIMVVLSQKEKIGNVLSRRLDVGVKGVEADLQFQEALKERLLQNGQYSRELIERSLQQVETEREERRAANSLVLEQAGTTKVLAAQAIEVMQDFADVARMSANGQGKHAMELQATLGELNTTMGGIGFLLAQLGFVKRQGISFEKLVEALKEPGEQ